jgi:predicted transcriptional regulator
MHHSDNVELLKTLASETRLGVVELLLTRPDGLRFNDIAKALKTYPSTVHC